MIPRITVTHEALNVRNNSRMRMRGHQKAQRLYVDALTREAPKLDPIEIKLRAGHLHAPKPQPAGGNLRLDLGAQAEQLARALRPEPVSEAASSARERKRRREMALTERLERRRNDRD